jgi:hypothetical protein
MDPPKTRRESKKDPKVKAQGKTIYSAKHIRLTEAAAARTPLKK